MASILSASETGNKALVEELIFQTKKDNNPQALTDLLNDYDYEGNFPLHLAAKGGHLEIVKCLIENGAQNKYNMEFQSPIELASEAKKMDVVKYLVENVETKDKDGRICLARAAKYGNKNIVFDLIYKHICEENITLASSLLPSSVYHRNKTYINYRATQNRVQNCIKEYIDTSKIDETPVECAAKNGNAKILQYLLLNGAEYTYNIADQENMTLLHYAATDNYNDVVETILNHMHHKNPDIFEEYINQTNRYDGGTALHYAAMYGNKDVIKTIVNHLKANNPALLQPYINKKDSTGGTPLHWAAEFPHVDAVTFLLNSGAQFNAVNGDNDTALHFVTNDLKVTKALVSFVKNNYRDKIIDFINTKNCNGDTALDMAKKFERTNIQNYLLKNGAK